MVCCFLFTEKPFDTTQTVNYAVSNIISSIVYGSRFEYTDPQFTAMVDRANENVRVGGSISVGVSIINILTKNCILSTDTTKSIIYIQGTHFESAF